MSATVNVVEANGAGPTWTTITAARYCTEDAYNPGTVDPCVVPTSGTNYSYWKTHALALSGSYTQITNIRWYTPGSLGWTLGTGGKIQIGQKTTSDQGVTAANYAQATGTTGTTGNNFDDAGVGHAFYKSGSSNYSAPVDATTFTSAAPCQVDNTTVNSGAVTATTGVVTQVLIKTDATQGTQSAVTFTFRWDEI